MMALVKRATKQVHKAGVNKNIEIHRHTCGFIIEDRRYTAQTGKVYRSEQEAIKAALSGIRPRELRQ